MSSSEPGWRQHRPGGGQRGRPATRTLESMQGPCCSHAVQDLGFYSARGETVGHL